MRLASSRRSLGFSGETTDQSPESDLSQPCIRPTITFLIKGLISTGKSTLFNAILSKNISKASMKRQTMCQVILTEDPAADKSQQAIYDHIEAINKEVYERVRCYTLTNFMIFFEWFYFGFQTETGKGLPYLREVPVSIAPVHGFIPRIEGVDYRFVETVGFDDPKTDPLNRKWFSNCTKWSDVVLFVTDKEKCMNTRTEQSLFKETVRDINEAKSIGKNIPIILVINKVEEPNDEEVKGMIAQCQANVRRIMVETGIPDHPIEFVTISSITALHHRMFMSNRSFKGMSCADIARLAELELGRKGKSLAHDKSKHPELVHLLMKTMEDQQQLNKESGFNKLADAIDKHVISKVLTISYELFFYKTIDHIFWPCLINRPVD